MPKIARKEDHDRSAELGGDRQIKIARTSAQPGADAARESLEHARTSATAAADDKLQTMQRSAGESAELGQAILDLLGAQTRHNIQFVSAFGRCMNWGQVVEIQHDFLNGSFDRMTQLGERYRSMMQASMKSTNLPNRR